MIQINKLPPFKRMCVTIGNLPTSFMESMSYYETLCWLYRYLSETVIPTVNNTCEAVTELQNAFTLLENYVNTYFDNLDVQEEINNKLDDMAESGELTDIIAQYLGLAGVLAYDTVSDMKNATNLVEGSITKTLGYHSVNDGGQSFYKVRSVTNEDTVNEMELIALSDNSLVAELMAFKEINVKQVGAKGDGEHDDTTMIQNCIDNFDVITIPDGTYKITSTINLTSKKNIKCYGTIKNNASIGFILNTSYCNIYIEKIDGNSSNTAFKITNNDLTVAHNYLEINQITNSTYGLYFEPKNAKGIQYNEIHFKNLYCSDSCIYFKGDDTTATWINDNNFYGGRLGYGTGVKMVKGTAQTDKFNSNKFYNVGFEDISCAANLQFANRNIFSNCRTSEDLTGSYWFILDADSCNNSIDTSTLELTKISDSINVNRTYNHYTAHPLTIDGIFAADYMRTNSGRMYFRDKYDLYQNFPQIDLYNQLNGVVSATYYYNGMTIICGGDDDGSYEVKLNEAFGQYGVTDFYLFVKNKTANSSLRVKNYENAIIVTYDNFVGALTNKLYHIRRFNSMEPMWKIVSVY